MHRAISLAALLAAPAWAVPAAFTHQGRLLDAEGAPRNGAVTLDFGLFAAAEGGGAVWTESHDLTLADGHYSVVLGEASPLGAHLAAATTWYLGVSLGGDALGPRTPLLSVPYAARAGGVVTHADSPPACDAAAIGGLAYDTVAGALQVCDGDAWQDVGGAGAPSCAELKRRNPASPSQVYTIYPDGVELSAFCDMGTEQGGWTLCLAVETTSRHLSDDFPDGSRWYDAVFTDRAASWVAFDGSAPLPGRGEVAGSFGCERLQGTATEVWFQAIYTNGQTKSLIATLPQAALAGTWTANSTRLEKRGTWSASTVDRLCAIDAPNLLISPLAGSCATTSAHSSASSTFLLGAIGPSYENGTGTCDGGSTKLDACGVFLTDNQDAWTGENDEIGDHGTYGGWGWSGDPSPQRVNVYLR